MIMLKFYRLYNLHGLPTTLQYVSSGTVGDEVHLKNLLTDKEEFVLASIFKVWIKEGTIREEYCNG